LFNPDTVIDNATIADAHKLSTGIERVWVNGQEVYIKGKPTGKVSGKVIYREE